MWLNYGILATICALAVAQPDPADPSDPPVPPEKLQPSKNGTADAHIGEISGHHQSFPHPLPFPHPPFPFPHPFPSFPFPGSFPHPMPMPIPPFFPPFPPIHRPPVPPIDRFICTLDAMILAVLGPPRKPPTVHPPIPVPIGAGRNDPDVGIGIIGPCLPGFPAHRCGNTVRVRCAETAVLNEHTCTTCCQLASREHGIRNDQIKGILIDSKQLTPNHHGIAVPFVGLNNRQKRVPKMEAFMEVVQPPPSCATHSAPCSTLKCMCCGPRIAPPHHHHPPSFPPHLPFPTFPHPSWPFPNIGEALGAPPQPNPQQMPVETK